MPPKVRELEAILKKNGCTWEPGKGSHRRYSHPDAPGHSITISGQKSDDVKHYQVKAVEQFLQAIKKANKSN